METHDNIEKKSHNKTKKLKNFDKILKSTHNKITFFVDPNTGVHTQSIESIWGNVKYFLKLKKGIVGDKQHYLNEWMYRNEFLKGKSVGEQFQIVCSVMNKWFHKC